MILGLLNGENMTSEDGYTSADFPNATRENMQDKLRRLRVVAGYFHRDSKGNINPNMFSLECEERY